MKRHYTLLLVALVFSTFACTGDSPKQVSSPVQAAKTKPGKKVSENAESPETKTLSGDTEISKATLSEFILKHGQPGTEFSFEDEKYLAQLPEAPQAGSIEEAAIMVGIIKLAIKTSKKITNQFQEEELYPAPEVNQPKTNNVSLEAFALEKQVDFPSALATNPILKSFTVFSSSLKAVKSTNNSDEFNQQVLTVIANQTAQWQALGAANGMQNQLQIEELEQPQTIGSELSAADLRSGDSLLMEAQSLAENRQYHDAINKAKMIETGNPLFQPAQDKIVSFSNKAVQELRQKAAQAFQNAIPVTDLKARSAYLEQAKLHLEEALSSFPQAPADQLSTVRENLAVITQDLERLVQENEQEPDEEQ